MITFSSLFNLVYKVFFEFMPPWTILIVVEVISPSSAKRDEKYKFKIYEDEKVPYYILVYPMGYIFYINPAMVFMSIVFLALALKPLSILIVTQRVYIMNDTISKNIAYGLDVNKDKIIKSLERV